MPPLFFTRYKSLFGSVQGMFAFDAALLMAVYAELSAEESARADTLEIGVHHGLSALLVAALRAEGARFVAIDLFGELQDQNISRSGAGDRDIFLCNMARIYGKDPDFMSVITAASSSLTPDELGRTYSFCHIDGGHSAEETYGDLALCSEILLPGGILVLDDHFNASYPGVAEGTSRFMIENRTVLTPLAIGFNKVVFQKGSVSRLNDGLVKHFPGLRHTTAEFWGTQVLLFGSNLAASIECARSTPHHLLVRDWVSMRVELHPQVSMVTGCPGEILSVPVRVENESNMTLCWSDKPIGLAYHLMSGSGDMLLYDSIRQYFHDPIQPGQKRVVNLPVNCPDSPGQYQLEIDLVWEGICWFKDQGNRTSVVQLEVA